MALTQEALSLGHFHGHDTVRGNLATLYLMLERYEDAANVSLALTKDAGIRKERIIAWARLAEIYSLTKVYDKIEAALNQAIDLATTDESVKARTRVLINVHKFGSNADDWNCWYTA